MSVRAPVGALNIADREYAIGRGLCSVVPRSAHDRFIWWSVNAAISDLRSEATGSTYEAVAVEDVAAIRVPAVSVEKQRRIADFLDTETARIDALITAKQRMIAGFGARRGAVTYLGVVGALDEVERKSSPIPWAPSIPSDWQYAKLTLLARLGSGHTPSRSHPEWWEDCAIPWITTGEVAQMRSDRIEEIFETRERISELGIANSSAEIHPKGTVVLCRTASAGYSAIMGSDMAVSQDFATWTCGDLLQPRYLLLCLRAMRRDLLERLATGSTHKTIYMPDIEAIQVPVPPVDEQLRIVNRVWAELHHLDELAATLSRQIELLKERRQALITAAVSGVLDL